MIDNYENNEKYKNFGSGYSWAFQKIFSKYLDYERKKRKKFEFIKNPSQIYLDVIFKNNDDEEEDNINNLFSEEEMDFDMHKFVINNKNKISENYRPSSKSLFKYLYSEIKDNNNKKEDEKKNILKLKLKKEKKIYKSLSQQLSPSIITFKNQNSIKFPKIMSQKGNIITRNKKCNNLLINTNIESNIIPNDNNNTNKILKYSLSINGKSLLINKKKRLKMLYNTGINTKINFKTINNYNKMNYFKRLNSLTNKSKEILKKITFYSNNQNLFINGQIKKYNLLNEKYTKKKNDYMTNNIIKFN